MAVLGVHGGLVSAGTSVDASFDTVKSTENSIGYPFDEWLVDGGTSAARTIRSPAIRRTRCETRALPGIVRAPSGVKLDIGYEKPAGIVKTVRGDSAQAVPHLSGRLFGQSCCPSSPRSMRSTSEASPRCMRPRCTPFRPRPFASDDLQAGFDPRLFDGNG